MKAVAILAVLWIHSMRAPWEPGVTTVEIWLGYVALFAVPTFLFCSGYLDASGWPARDVRAAMAGTRARLARLLVPYLVASCAAELFKVASGTAITPTSVLWDLLLACAFGPFYYVLIAVELALARPLIRCLGPRLLVALTAAAFAAQVAIELFGFMPSSIFWLLRNPLMWLPYYLAGWIVRAYAPSIRSHLPAKRSRLAWLLLASAVGLSSAGAALSARPLGVAAVYVWITLLYVVFSAAPRLPRLVTRIGDASYFFYLFHLFFIYAAQMLLARYGVGPTLATEVVYWAVAALGCVVLASALKAALGASARRILGI